MINIFEQLQGVNSVAICGHIRPDGDCVGSCMALYNYLVENTKDLMIEVFLESVPENFRYIKNIEKIITDYPDRESYDVVICLDSSDLDRIGQAVKYYNDAKKTICIDHHISNDDYAMVCHVLPHASSTCEVLYDVFEDEKISTDTAIALYTGLIHDTGVFKHSNTSKHTMEVAGKVIDKKVPFSKIIDESFYQKTFKQNKLLGLALIAADTRLDGKVIYSYIDLKTMEENDAKPCDLDGIIDQLRITKGVEVAILLHETEPNVHKVSMRSNNDVNVSEIAVSLGGGGHVKAAGCSIKGEVEDIISLLTDKIREQL